MKFYIEYDEVSKTWDIYEVDGGHEHYQYYDVFQFSTPTKEDAETALEIINKLIGVNNE